MNEDNFNTEDEMSNSIDNDISLMFNTGLVDNIDREEVVYYD